MKLVLLRIREIGLIRSRAAIFGVWPRTFPAFVSEPCVGIPYMTLSPIYGLSLVCYCHVSRVAILAAKHIFKANLTGSILL